MEIARFKMKPGIKLEDIPGLRDGGSWIHKKAVKFATFSLYAKYDITLNIGFPNDISKWNDFDYVLVLDEDFGQPYTPFYNRWNKVDNDFIPPKIMRYIIEKYNKIMQNLPYLEEVHD